MSRVAELRAWATNASGSTRSVALMRIAFVLLAWGELGEPIQPHRGNALISWFFYVTTFLALIGFRAQYAIFASGVAMMLAISTLPGQMLHHTYLLSVSMMLLALTPCGRSLSVDRLRAPGPEEGNLWALRLLGLELSAMLFWSSYNKLTFGTHAFQTAYLTGDRLEQMLVYAYSGFPFPKPLLAVLGTATVAIELAASVLLWIPKYRTKALVAYLGITVFYQVALPIRGAGALFGVLLLAFVPPEVVHRAIDRVLRPSEPVVTK